MTTQDNRYALVADIGGTNTRVALADGSVVRPATIKRYANKSYPGLAAVLSAYLQDIGGATPVATCVAVAGPVQAGAATMTNLDWAMDLQTLRDATQATEVDILNDLQAQGYAVGYIADEHLTPVLPGQRSNDPHAASLVIGVGTGFNAAPAFETPHGRFVPPSECGHVSMTAQTDEQDRLSAFIIERHGFSSVEDALSGRGLERVYRFVGSEMGNDTPKSAEEIMADAAKGDLQARNTIRLVVEILGAVAGDIALTQLPFGGIFLIGGLSRALSDYFEEFGFGTAFRNKGRFSEFMDQFPVSVVTDDYAALTGCAAHMAGIIDT